MITILIVNTHQFCYMFNYGNLNNAPNVVTHSPNYNGTGGDVIVKIGINPASMNLNQFRTPILNNILIWNLQIATQKNTKPLADPNKYDMESVTLHEMGHSLGLAHTNLASESGLSPPQSESTSAYKNTNGYYDVNPGSDGVYGSSDDIRGDDLNLNFFNPANNPFILATPADKSNYKSNVAYLPSGHRFAATGGISESISLVSKRNINNNEESQDLFALNELAPIFSYQNENSFGNSFEVEEKIFTMEVAKEMEFQHLCTETLRTHPDHAKRIRDGTTEAIMQQGTYNGEYQRTLSADDVAAIAYARAGLDEIAGTSDDYNLKIVYAGDVTGNDIDIFLDPSYAYVGSTSAGANTLPNLHYDINNDAKIKINPSLNWYYNPYLATVIALPSSQSLSILSNSVMNLDLYFASSGPSYVTSSHLAYTSSIGGSVFVNQVESNHYSIQISGFSASGSPCIQFASTSLSDTRYGTYYEPSNTFCFSVSYTSQSAASSTPSKSMNPSPSNPPSISPSATQIPVSQPNAPIVSAPSDNGANPSPTRSVFPTVSPISRHYGNSIIAIAKVQCGSQFTTSDCCTNFGREWPTMSNFNTQALVRVKTCTANGQSTSITFVQSGSESYSADVILGDYFQQAGCSSNLNSICTPNFGALSVASSWTTVDSIQKVTSITYAYDNVYEVENEYHVEIEEPLEVEKRNINAFEREVLEFVHENSAALLSQCLLVVFPILMAVV